MAFPESEDQTHWLTRYQTPNDRLRKHATMVSHNT